MLGFAVPLVLILTKSLMFPSMEFFEKSLSAYYYTDAGLLFTGLLVAIGISLVSFRGYDRGAGEWLNEDTLGTIAGIAALGTGTFPPGDGLLGYVHPSLYGGHVWNRDDIHLPLHETVEDRASGR